MLRVYSWTGGGTVGSVFTWTGGYLLWFGLVMVCELGNGEELGHRLLVVVQHELGHVNSLHLQVWSKQALHVNQGLLLSQTLGDSLGFELGCNLLGIFHILYHGLHLL